MQIDVIDIGMDEIKFKRNYETGRFQRAKRLHGMDRIKISNVDYTTDSNGKNYKVTASVMGNSGIYRVTVNIKNGYLEQASCTCPDEDGRTYCKHILATCLEITGPHRPSTALKIQEFQKKQEEEQKEKMREFFRQRELERQRVEYRRKYGYALDVIDRHKRFSNDTLNVQTLYENVKLMQKYEPDEYELASNIHLETKLVVDDSETLSVLFRIGSDKMYMLKDIPEFADAFKDEKILTLGKKLVFKAKRENFAKQDQEVLDYILQYNEILKYSEKLKENYSRYYYSSYYDMPRKEMIVNKDNIDSFMDIIKDKTVYVGSRNLNDKEFKPYIFTKEEYCPKVKIKRNKENELELTFDMKNYNYIESNNNIYLIRKGKIYTVPKTNQLQSVIDAFESTHILTIPKDKTDEFVTYVLSKWEKYLDEGYVSENSVKDQNQSISINKLASKMYLDVDDDGNVTLKTNFCYNDAEFNILSHDYEKYIKEHNVKRNITDEQDVLIRLFKDGFELENSKDYLVLKDVDKTYDFIVSKIDSYMNDFEVLVTDKFKSKTIKRPKISNVGVRIDNNLLEIDMSNMDIDVEEIKNILQSYNVKKKYYKLKNGDLIDLSKSDDLDLLNDMSNSLDIDFSKLSKGTVKLPINRSMYLEKILGGKGLNITKNDEYNRLIDNINDKNFSESIVVNKDFEDVLRNYQKTGYKWLKTLDSYGFGGILADDMGLGKTLQIISVIWEYVSKNEKSLPSIVICPSSLVLNWKAEFEKWAPKMKVLIPNGTKETRKVLIETYAKYDVIVTSYDLLKRDVEEYEEKKFKYIIADEAQYIKNSTTQNASALKSLEGEIKFALTGTPIENSIAELWSIFDYIMPNYLYNYNKFKKKFEGPIVKDSDEEALRRLKQMIEPFVLRRIKTDVLSELPEKNITVMKNEMTPEQQKLYISYMAQIKHQVADELSENGFAKSKFKILMLLTRLRQICCHPSLFLENYNGGSGKLEQCMDILNEAISGGHKVLLFSQYTSMFEIIEEKLNKEKISYYKLTGETPVSKRVDMVESFNKDENVKVFLISLKAGGTGLNLTGADVVMHYDPWWNLSSENQATDRAYRIGQKNSVQVYKFITTNSIEEKINKLQEKKAKLSEDLLSTEEKFINTLSKEEVMALFE